MPHPPRRRTAVAALAAAAVLAPLAWFWQASLVPATWAATDMGVHDVGGAPHDAAHHPADARPVASLTTASDRPADVRYDLVARAEEVRLAPGVTVPGFTLNGSSPGPELRVREGDLVEVRLTNESVEGGTTLHWHGVDVPNAADGVAGVTQDAVPVGGEFTYRFVADRAGTYWYHSHQLSHEQVRRGLLGALVVEPADLDPAVLDTVALVHQYGGRRTVNGRPTLATQPAEPGAVVRVRVINTDNAQMPVWVQGAPYRLLAIDGTDVVDPSRVDDARVHVTAGGRADLEVTLPDDGTAVRVEMGGSAALVLGDPARAADDAGPVPDAVVDPLTYGSPATRPFDPDRPDREFEYRIGRRPGFVDGMPGIWWTVNGRTVPDVPMYVVAEGDVVRMRISNSSGDEHPMHLHGHHALVLARDGVPATGSPWWVDSLDVANGETYDIAFLADNPGLWMDHCHNLPHASDGLVAHLMYEGVTASYLLGDVNLPE